MVWLMSAEAERLMFCQVGLRYIANSLVCDMTIRDQPAPAAAAAGDFYSNGTSLLIPAVQ